MYVFMHTVLKLMFYGRFFNIFFYIILLYLRQTKFLETLKNVYNNSACVTKVLSLVEFSENKA